MPQLLPKLLARDTHLQSSWRGVPLAPMHSLQTWKLGIWEFQTQIFHEKSKHELSFKLLQNQPF